MASRTSRSQTVTALPQLPERPRDAHKGMFGRVLAVGGSAAMAGSVALVANAAYRSGAGLVRIFCPASAQPIAIGQAICATSAPAAETADGHFSLVARYQLLEQAAQHDVIAMGPGMGRSGACERLVYTAIVEAETALVLDADGLNNLAGLGRIDRVAGLLVITPHPGEANRLLAAFGLNVELSHEPKARRAAAEALAHHLDCICVLKGAGTVVAGGGQVYVNDVDNPGMATGGTGDVLTGVIAALLGQGFSAFDAAVLGVHLHGMAGEIAAERFGQYSMIASDLLETLGEAFRRHGGQ